MSPYRNLPLVVRAEPAKKSLWRRFRRKLLVWWRGRYLDRFQARCPECGIASWDPRDTANWNECGTGKTKDICFYRCGHELPELISERQKLWGKAGHA